MTDRREPGESSGLSERERVTAGFREAQRFRLTLSLRATPAERLRDLEGMIEFAAMAEATNPRLRMVAERLRSRRLGF
jgi:hypothetical protein